MGSKLDKYKGIHPGQILERELKKRGIVKSHFAEMVHEHPQTLNAIFKGRRKIPIALCFKIDDALSFEEGTMYHLQAQYEMQHYIQKFRRKAPVLAAKLRPGLFWDTNINTIDWENDSEAIIIRVLERGDEEEKKIITEIYGKEKVQLILQDLYQNRLHHINRNISNFGWRTDLEHEKRQNTLLFLPFTSKDNILYPKKVYSIRQSDEAKAAEPVVPFNKKKK